MPWREIPEETTCQTSRSPLDWQQLHSIRTSRESGCATMQGGQSATTAGLVWTMAVGGPAHVAKRIARNDNNEEGGINAIGGKRCALAPATLYPRGAGEIISSAGGSGTDPLIPFRNQSDREQGE